MPRLVFGPALCAAVALFVSACGQHAQPPPDLLQGRAFAAIPRNVTSTATAMKGALHASSHPAALTASAGTDSFYLAIKKSELAGKFFFSGYLTQYAAQIVGYNGVATSLGTRVVTFKLENDRLIMMDGSNYIDLTYNSYGPPVLYEAWPLVTDSTLFNQQITADQYVLIDPSAGLSRFTLASSLFDGNQASLDVQLSYLQRYRQLTDGVTWEQVFTGQSNKPIAGSDQLADLYRASGTMAMSLRRYSEGAGFVPLYADSWHFFRTELGNNLKWNLQPGGAPIQWTISANATQALAYWGIDPTQEYYDIPGAMKAGVESWNQVFGYQALAAHVGDGTESPGDDDVNYLYYDLNTWPGFAFANWRDNPVTGEARGASVYFNNLWFLYAWAYIQDDPNAPAAVAAQQQAAAALAKAAQSTTAMHVSWNGIPMQDDICELAPQALLGADGQLVAPAFLSAALPATSGLTKRQKVERFISHVIAHEVGHTLGLRHNFAGSLTPPSSSVMDYLDNTDRILTPVPQSYDAAAIGYLYLGGAYPSQKFCTDGATMWMGFTPPLSFADCSQFDRGAIPYGDFWKPQWEAARAANSMPGYTPAVGLLRYVGHGGGNPLDVWNYAWSQVSVISPPATRLKLHDSWVNMLLYHLFLEDPTLPYGSNAAGIFATYGGPLSPVAVQAIAELKAQLSDPLATIYNRRSALTILKAAQQPSAMQALIDARAALVAQQPATTGDAADYLRDLITRIDLALNPYFK
jgi:Met-zincin